MAEKKSCFIIMPITTPESFIDKYRDGAEHFMHVLECLFIPSAEKAGYKPIPPKAKGSDLIHAEIISNLETSDLVLCDMSCLNPNVFFEFGIRTSLNKPVCVVKDDLTEKVPFDTGILNHQEYTSSLDSWILDKEIVKLSEHLSASQDSSKGENNLWKYFGFKSKAQPYEGKAGTDDKLDYLAMQLESLHQKVEGKEMTLDNRNIKDKYLSIEPEIIEKEISRTLPHDVRLSALVKTGTNTFDILYCGTLLESDQLKIKSYIKELYGVKVRFNPF
ncbi:MAG: hypothetical protein FVQ84_21055 [Planctomycetes bacterium]|nr:hypothetical protein [Planctomycetota bacterium]